jgi:hypothetical protein
MVSTSTIATFEELMIQLKDEKLPFRRDTTTKDTLTVPTRLGEENSVIHIRWAPIPGIIQFVQILPFTVPENRRNDISLLISRINLELPILGFTLNHGNGALAFRTHAFLGKQGAIAPGMIGAIIASAVRTTKAFLPKLKAAL